MSAVSEEIRWWTAGEIDGDGCVGVYDQRLKVSVKKSCKSRSTVERLRDLYGGTITEVGCKVKNWEDQVQWVIRAEEARKFCAELTPYLFGKRPQFELASTLIIGRTPMIVKKGTEIKALKTVADLSKVVQMPMTTLKRRFAASHLHDVNGWSITILNKDSILAYRAEVEEKLRKMKHISHEPIIEKNKIHLAYFCGFVESDGCISILSKGYGVAVSQKYRSVLDAFQHRFGGSVRWVPKANTPIGGCWVWQMVAGARDCVRALLPYSFEKRDQMELMLECTNQNKNDIRSKMNALKGRRYVDFNKQGPRSTIDYEEDEILNEEDKTENDEQADKLSEDALEQLLESAGTEE